MLVENVIVRFIPQTIEEPFNILPLAVRPGRECDALG